MTQADLEADLSFLMNVQSAHNLILRALLRANPPVVDQLRAFLEDMIAQNDDQRELIEEVTKLLPRPK